MKKKFTKLISLVLIVVVLLGIAMPIASASGDAIDQFVTRLYRNILFRESDSAGFQYWTSVLRNRTQTGANVAHGFFFSQEFINRRFSNEVFVDTLYMTLMNRTPDAAGKSHWVGRLNQGWPREDIFAGFVNSVEFDGICNAAGITRGTYTSAGRRGPYICNTPVQNNSSKRA